MCEKRKNGAECIGGIKIQTLAKYKDRVAQDKESLERQNYS